MKTILFKFMLLILVSVLLTNCSFEEETFENTDTIQKKNFSKPGISIGVNPNALYFKNNQMVQVREHDFASINYKRFSIEIVFNTNDNLKDVGGILFFLYNKDTSPYDGFYSFVDDDRITFVYKDNNSSTNNGSTILTAYGLNTNQCYHLSIVKNLNILSMYVDTTLVAQTTINHPGDNIMNVNNQVLFFGCDYSSASGNRNFYSGKIDEFRLWSKALTLNDITNNQFSELPVNSLNDTSLRANYRFNVEYGSQTVQDYSIYENNGFLGSTNYVDQNDPFRVGNVCMD